MPQPPTIPILPHENVRAIPALSQKTFYDGAAGAGAIFRWEFDLGLRVTDPNQFLNTNPAPTASFTIAGGGAGPQTTPQPAIGPWLDWYVYTSGVDGGGVAVSYAPDSAPMSYGTIFSNTVPGQIPTNASGLRVTGRFAMLAFTNFTAASIVNVGFYIRSWS